jgi:Glycosyl transferase family 2
MPRVAVCLMTYNRFEYASRTVRALYRRVQPRPHLHIADDGSPGDYIKRLVDVAHKVGAPAVTFTNSERGGYGRNVNLASQVTHQLADYVLMIEDDWELLHALELPGYIEDMESERTIDCVRLGYLSWTQPLYGRLVAGINYKYLLLDGASPEPHVFAGHPRLERVSYQREVGEWPEGLDPNQTEFAVAHAPRARVGVAWRIGLDPREGSGLFAHIGTERAR